MYSGYLTRKHHEELMAVKEGELIFYKNKLEEALNELTVVKNMLKHA